MLPCEATLCTTRDAFSAKQAQSHFCVKCVEWKSQEGGRKRLVTVIVVHMEMNKSRLEKSVSASLFLGDRSPKAENEEAGFLHWSLRALCHSRSQSTKHRLRS